MRWTFLICCYKYSWAVSYEKRACLPLRCPARASTRETNQALVGGHGVSETLGATGASPVYTSKHPFVGCLVSAHLVDSPSQLLPEFWLNLKPVSSQPRRPGKRGGERTGTGGGRLSNSCLGSCRAGAHACHGSLQSAELQKTR